jgi:O-antigen/teichoic acid export membrane protein
VATGAKLQQSREHLAQGWLLALACIFVLGMPVAVVMAMLAGDLVRLLYGNAWSETGWVLSVMFLCLPAWACWGLSTPVLWNTNRRQYEFMLQLPLLALAVPAWWFAAPGGVRDVAIVSCAAIAVRAVVIVTASLRALDLRWSVLLPYVARGVALSLFAAAAVFAGQQAASSVPSPLVALLAGGSCAALALLAVLLFKPQALGAEARTALSRVLPVIGPRLAPRGEPVL